MQNKYLSALKTSYASYGFSKEALDRVASQRVKTIAAEEEIDADIASRDTFLLLMKEMQGATDSLRAHNTKIQKELDDFKANPSNKPAEGNASSEMAELRELLKGMQTKMEESEKKSRNEAIMKDAHAKMKAMGCTNDFIREATLKGLELTDADTADSIAEKYKSVYDENFKRAFGGGYTPPKGNQHTGGEDVDYDAMNKFLTESGFLPQEN